MTGRTGEREDRSENTLSEQQKETIYLYPQKPMTIIKDLTFMSSKS